MGDAVRCDEDGHPRPAGCVDDATKSLGHCTGFPEAESVSTIYFVAAERVTMGAFDETCG